MNGKYWLQVTPLMLAKGKRVEIDLVSHSMMAHPMHLHGHTFQVIAIDGRPIQGPVRDTVLVMLMGRVRIAFDADNPGRWPFHCHKPGFQRIVDRRCSLCAIGHLRNSRTRRRKNDSGLPAAAL